MCTGMEGMALAGGLQMGGTLLSGLSQHQYNRTQADMARADAQTEREAAQRSMSGVCAVNATSWRQAWRTQRRRSFPASPGR